MTCYEGLRRCTARCNGLLLGLSRPRLTSTARGSYSAAWATLRRWDYILCGWLLLLSSHGVHLWLLLLDLCLDYTLHSTHSDHMSHLALWNLRGLWHLFIFLARRLCSQTARPGVRRGRIHTRFEGHTESPLMRNLGDMCSKMGPLTSNGALAEGCR